MAWLKIQKRTQRCFGVLLVASSLCSLLPACQAPSVNHVQWEPVSEDEVVQALRYPTGIVGTLPPADILDLVEGAMPALLETAKFIGHLAAVINDVTNSEEEIDDGGELPPQIAPPPEEEGSTWGSSLYLKIACPGDALVQPYDFANGEVRLDTPEFNGLDLSSLTTGGQFLLSFDQCKVGSLDLDAAFAGIYFSDLKGLDLEVPPEDPDYPLQALALDIGSADIGSDHFGFIGYACGSAFSTCQDDVRVFAELDTGASGTYTVAFRVTRDYWLGTASVTVLIRGADAESTCTFTASQATPGALPLGLSCATVAK